MYAAEQWADHARFGNVSSNVQDGMKCLFDAFWFQILYVLQKYAGVDLNTFPRLSSERPCIILPSLVCLAS
jgi:hypothetical protein